jgi:WD40 repeat protein
MLATSGRDGLIKFWDLRKTSSSTATTADYDDPTTTADHNRRIIKKQRPSLVARGGHRHWATKVQFNPFHDQLVLSSGTDSIVNLWRMSTISSAPLVIFDEDDLGGVDPLLGGERNPAIDGPSSNIRSGNNTEDGTKTTSEGPNVRVSRYEHMDSVNAIAWGAADAWVYVTASYDGKVVLNHVPSKEKYKILL